MTSFILGILATPFIVFGYPVYQVNFFDSGWENKTAADCLMVLGAKVLNNNSPDLMMRERINTAVHLISDQKVILSGGTVDQKKSEAEVMKELLVENGIDESLLVLETKSTSTYQNLLYSKPLLEECEMVDMVSNDFHLARVKMTADRLGIPTNRLIPAQSTKPNSNERLLREYLAYAWYWLAWGWMEKG
ncbi:MAG: YdcF family protein [Candidatus Gracilibacteria bacterium]|nr:YdcF family protein [Candidatus Gracilibacteria bacterium]